MASSKIAVRLPRLSLLGKFALVSLIPIVLLGLVLAKTLQVQIRNQALTSARQLAALVARLDIQPQLRPDDLSQGLTQERLQRLDQALHAGLVGEEIARVKIWSRDLRVVYSDDPGSSAAPFPPPMSSRRRWTGTSPPRSPISRRRRTSGTEAMASCSRSTSP
jgi:hypothetical protein